MNFNNVKTITEERYIAGLFRDAILNSRDFIVESSRGDIFSGKVIEFQETWARLKTDSRRICIKTNTTIPSIDQDELAVKCSYPRFLLKFIVKKIDLIDNRLLSFDIPQSVELVVLRKSVRIDTEHLKDVNATAILKTSKNKYICSANITDISEDGFGLALKISKDVIKNERICSVDCTLINENGEIRAKGDVAWSSYDHDEKYLNIGIKHTKSNDSALIQNQLTQDRRTQNRVNATWPIELVSPINPKFISQFELIDVSHKGFKGRVINPAEKILFPINAIVKVRNLDVFAEVKSNNGNQFSFNFHVNTKDSLVRLSKLITTFSNNDISLSTPATEDVLEVFTASGSISSNLAQAQSSFHKSIVSSLESASDKSSWYLRWFQRNEMGQIRGTISTILFGDSVWYNGALAGHLDQNLKISKDFVKRYYNHLHSFLSAFNPEQLLFFNWFTDNIWWFTWEKYLEDHTKDSMHFRFFGKIIYLNLNFFTKGFGLDSDIKIRSIRSIKATELIQLISNIKSEKHKTILNLLGLNFISFGSEHLKQIICNDGGQFLREYYEISNDDFLAIVILSKFPEGVTPNGIINYPYVLILDYKVGAKIYDIIYPVMELSAKHGIMPSAFFITADDGINIKNINLKSETTSEREIVWTLGTKSVLDFWLKDE